jgi:hypothetical protein
MTWIQTLIAMAVILQTFEYLQMKPAFANSAPWGWPTLRRDYAHLPFRLDAFFGVLFSYRGFIKLLELRLTAGLIALFFPNAIAFGILCVTTWLIAVRWRGTFNGGSDAMTLQILLAVFVSWLFPNSPFVQKFALVYIALQLVLSYTIAGIVKLHNAQWRTGAALQDFLRFSNATRSRKPQFKLANSKGLSRSLSWLIIGFECAFPLAVMNSTLCLIMLSFAFLFHLANFYFFGLNRFVFAWVAAYPALYLVSNPG